jgi:hypothetical protein
MNTALAQLRALAPTLSGAALKVLIELTAAAAATNSAAIAASSRNLAERCKLSRRSVQPALDELARLAIIASSDANPTAAATHTLQFLQTVPEVRQTEAQSLHHPGAESAPPQAQSLRPPGPDIAPPPAQELRHPGAENAPPAIPSPETRARAFEIFDFDKASTIERLQRAQTSDYDQATVDAIRGAVWHHQSKSARPNPEPPDDALITDLLAIVNGEWARLSAMLSDLHREKKMPSENYAWYRTVTLQRTCGITAAEAKHAIDALLEARKQAKRSSNRKPQQQASPEEISHLQAGLKSAAAGKAMR